MILDIGCGKNVLSRKSVIHADRDKKSHHLEMVCDIQYLPFIVDAFSIVQASHILEHLELHELHRGLKEISRVSEYGCVIKVPNAKMLKIEESNQHLFSWIGGTLRNFLLKYFPKVRVYGNIWRVHRSNKLQTLKLLTLSVISNPYELIAVCYNNGDKK